MEDWQAPGRKASSPDSVTRYGIALGAFWPHHRPFQPLSHEVRNDDSYSDT
jgi:hypothetical protein